MAMTKLKCGARTSNNLFVASRRCRARRSNHTDELVHNKYMQKQYNNERANASQIYYLLVGIR